VAHCKSKNFLCIIHFSAVTYKVVQVSIDDGVVLGGIDCQTSASIGDNGDGGSPKGGQDNSSDTLESGSDNVSREHGTQVQQNDNSRNGKREGGAKDGPTGIGVGISLRIFLREDSQERPRKERPR
jgi:hypothetical protein